MGLLTLFRQSVVVIVVVERRNEIQDEICKKLSQHESRLFISLFLTGFCAISQRVTD